VQAVVVPAVGHNALDVLPQYLESVQAFIAGQ
jgi:hypothetical protein